MVLLLSVCRLSSTQDKPVKIWVAAVLYVSALEAETAAAPAALLAGCLWASPTTGCYAAVPATLRGAYYASCVWNTHPAEVLMCHLFRGILRACQAGDSSMQDFQS
jgi:hypothetical protein